MKRLCVLLLVLAAQPAVAMDYSTRQECLNSLSDAIRQADSYERLPKGFERRLKDAPDGAELKASIVQSHEQIAQAMRQIADDTFKLCALYDE